MSELLKFKERKWLRNNKDSNSFVRYELEANSRIYNDKINFSVDGELVLHDCDRKISYELYAYGNKKRVVKEMKRNVDLLERLQYHITVLLDEYEHLMEQIKAYPEEGTEEDTE